SADGGRTYTAVYTPVANSRQTASISVNANTYTDAVGNSGLASNALNLTLDTQLPSLTVTGTTVTEGNSGISYANVTVSLSAASSQVVTVNYATQDGTATAGTDYQASSNLLSFAPGQTSQTLQIPVLGDTLIESNETLTINLSNPTHATLSANSSATVTLNNDDTLIPSLTLSSSKTNFKAGDTALLTFTFNVIPVGFTASDISVMGGTLGAQSYTSPVDTPLQGGMVRVGLTDMTRVGVNDGTLGGLSVDTSGKVYTINFTPTANINNLNASISVNANTYTDAVGNNGQSSNSLSFTGDTLAPSLSISSDKTSLKANETATVTFSFSEMPMGFDASDISVSGGSISALNGSGLTRTALFIPMANINNLNASISVIPNSYTDTAGNTGIVINSLSLTADTQAPSLSISSDKTSLQANETATVTFSFSEMPMGFDASDISVSGGSISGLNGTGLTRTALF
ncbi:MAG: Ig-like domain-containing protein, partial [Methylococcaceae bacterium]